MKKYHNYKGVKVDSFGIPIFNMNKNNVNKSIRGYSQHICFSFKSDKTLPKKLIIMYDISYEKRKERDWFRRHLKKLNFIMIQKSVWVGPSPLPKDFLDYVKSIGLLSQLKTFKLAKPYTGEENVYKNAL